MSEYHTFKEWRELGYGVRKGEKSHRINQDQQAVFSDKQVMRIATVDDIFNKIMHRNIESLKRDI